jgi:ParB family transcriptional regulator, chromosome partitioning protein
MSQIFQVVSTEKLYESPLNPRKIYTEKGLDELTESIKTKGILTPLLVRPNDGRFEIAAGHRRYRAALRLDLAEIPVLIREMNDNDFLELITIENLQREDVHPLDEAQGYRTLIEKTGLDIPTIAAKVGKSVSYVYQRLKLANLTPAAREAFSAEKITAGHAILIARLQPDDQKTALKECIESKTAWGDTREGMSTRELAEFIENEIHLDLNSAPFSKKDADLVSEAGPCMTCPKRTGFQPELFPDIKKKDTCTDRMCFQRKIEAHTVRWIQKKSEDSDIPPLKLSGDSDYRAKKIPDDPEKPIPANLYHEITDKKKESCEHVQEGIIVEGRNKGKILTICTDPKCKIHHGYGGYTVSPGELARRKAEEAKRKFNETVRNRILDHILGNIGATTLSLEDQRFIAARYFNTLWDEYRKKIFKRHGWEVNKGQYNRREYRIEKILASMMVQDLNRLSLEMALISFIRFDEYSSGHAKSLFEIAERHSVDVKSIEAQVKAEIKAKAEKKGKGAAKIGKKPFDPDGAVKAARHLHKDLGDKAAVSKKPKKKVQTAAKKAKHAKS